MIPLLKFAFSLYDAQMVDSPLASTRVYWRRRLGYPEAIVHDPRPLIEAANLMPEQEIEHDR
jgi:hypothetical protein